MRTDKSSVAPVRQSKYSIFPQTIEKPSTRERRSRGLLHAGDSIISNEISVSQEPSQEYSPPSNVSAYIPKSSENYPSASTALNSSSTMARMRGKSRIMKKNNYIKLPINGNYGSIEK